MSELQSSTAKIGRYVCLLKITNHIADEEVRQKIRIVLIEKIKKQLGSYLYFYQQGGGNGVYREFR